MVPEAHLVVTLKFSSGLERNNSHSITDSMDMNLSKLQEIVMDREVGHTAVLGVAKNWT